MDDDPHVEAAIVEFTRAKRRASIRAIAFILVGAMVGVGYHYTIGCSTGGCVLTATPERSAVYGMVVGLVLAML